MGGRALKALVLGSSAAWPIPRLGCDCAQCTSPDPRDRRLRTSLLVDGRILVDAGPDAYQQLQQAGVLPETILLTHHHHDHMLGLHVLSKAGRLPLHMTKESERGVRTIFPRIDFRVMHLTPGVKLELGGGLVAQAFDVAHSENTRTMAFRFTSDAGGSLVYIPDMSAAPDSKLARGADVVILDGSTRERPARGHMPMTETLELLPRLKAGRALFTHIGHRTGTHAELEQWLGDRAGAVYDGLEMEF